MREVSVAASPREDDALLTAKELEAWLKIDVKTIYAYVQLGFIPYIRIRSNIRFAKRQIIEWLRLQNFVPRPMGGSDRGGA